VLVTISDKKLAVASTTDPNLIAYYNADVVTANDYYPFGMNMPDRKFSQPSSGYRYGFNGKEQDKETIGTSTYDYGFRIYNPALGRFLSVDPLTKDYPWYTPYQFAGNKPIACIDLDGLEEFWVIDLPNGGKEVILHKVDAPFVVVYNGERLKAFPQQNMNDYYKKNVIVKSEEDGNGNNRVSSVRQFDDAGNQVKKTFAKDFNEDNDEPFQQFPAEVPLPIKEIPSNIKVGATITQSDNIQVADESKGKKSLAPRNITVGNIGNGFDILVIDFSSMGTTPSTFTVTTVNPEGVINTNSWTGTQPLGNPVTLPVKGGSKVDVKVTPGDETSKYNFNIKRGETMPNSTTEKVPQPKK
jgi:RHS repeat-associated protein